MKKVCALAAAAKGRADKQRRRDEQRARGKSRQRRTTGTGRPFQDGDPTAPPHGVEVGKASLVKTAVNQRPPSELAIDRVGGHRALGA